MDNILKAAEPIIQEVLQYLLYLVIAAAVGIINKNRKRIEAWFDSRTTAAQREELQNIAGQAYAFVEHVYKDNNGDEKLQKAIQYVVARTNMDKMGINENDIIGAVQKAWAELDKKKQ